MSSIETKNINVNGLNIQYLAAGNRDPLLLLHSWPTCSAIYSRSLPILAQTYRCIAPDLPGFGKSDQLPENHNYWSYATFIKNFMDKMEIPQANIAAVSFGGAVALIFTSLFPERVKSLALNSPPLYYKKELRSVQKIGLQAMRLSPAVRSLMFWAVKNELPLAYKVLGRDVPTRGPEADVFQHAKNSQLRAVFDSLESLMETNIEPELDKVSAPTLVFYGSNDDKYIKSAKVISAKIQQGKLLEVPNANHHLVIDMPDLFASTLIHHFSSIFPQDS